MEESIATLLESYGFELTAGETPYTTAARWLNMTEEAEWVRFAILEALYQGRYKTVSVEQILRAWQRRGQAVRHFTPEFERFICERLPQRHAPTAPPPPLPRSLLERPSLGLSEGRERFPPLPDRFELFAQLQKAAELPNLNGAGNSDEQSTGKIADEEGDDSEPAATD
ncbi:MAG: hypothetical protein AAFY11_09085 [Cyanobacteria bacterium J06641_5]